MQIEKEELTEDSIWEKVTYVPGHAEGDRSHADCETGFLKSWNDKFVFVKFLSNTCACRPEDLVWG